MKIMLVDDSALIRSILKQVLEQEPGFKVVAEASNGAKAVEMVAKAEPDFIIMDINMPILNGLEAAKEILKENFVPILIFSSEVNAQNSFEAINNGALDVLKKPDISELNDSHFYHTFISKIHELVKIGNKKSAISKHRNIPREGNIEQSKTAVSKTGGMPGPVRGENRPFQNRLPTQANKSISNFKVLVIGASTGGPLAVRSLLQALPADFPVGIGLVQHLGAGFERGYAAWLNEATALEVQLCEEKSKIAAGQVIVSPVGKHMTVAQGCFVLDDDPAVLNQKPAVDVLFKSCALEYRDKVLAILLTGMGKDGAAGCADIKRLGGHTLIQDENSSVIFGMPKVAIEMNGASEVVSIDSMPARIMKLTGGLSSPK